MANQNVEMLYFIERRRHVVAKQRREIETQLVKLDAKLAVYDEMLAELRSTSRPLTGSIAVVDVKPEPKKERKHKYPVGRSKGCVEAVELALQAAGSRGVTAREVAEVASMPIGTASGRLALMKAAGKATHIQPRYFAVHSKQQDNNDDQGRDQ